jgi:hypothetical protein
MSDRAVEENQGVSVDMLPCAEGDEGAEAERRRDGHSSQHTPSTALRGRAGMYLSVCINTLHVYICTFEHMMHMHVHACGRSWIRTHYPETIRYVWYV